MVPQAVMDAIQSDQRYAKAIISLAGIRTASTDGTNIDIAAYWDGEKFIMPVHLSINIPDVGRISWTSPTDNPRIFKQTLGKMENQFKAIATPPLMMLFSAIISKFTKKVHFNQLRSLPVKELPSQPRAEITLERESWDAEELEKQVKELVQAKRKLKGMGFGDATD